MWYQRGNHRVVHVLLCSLFLLGTVRPQGLVVNVDFNSSGGGGSGEYQGQGAYSLDDGPFWNQVDSQTSPNLENLIASDGVSETTIGFAISGASGTWAGATSSVTLITDYIFVENTMASFEFNGLIPGAEYKLYLYGIGDQTNQAAKFTIDGETKQTSAGAFLEAFQEDHNYVVFVVAADDTGMIVGTFEQGDTGSPYGGFNGFQIIREVLDKAYGPVPADEVTDVAPAAPVLQWQASQDALEHDVYFGTSYDAVNDADAASDAFVGRQSETSLALGRLELGQTYYWRVDEVNGLPDQTVFKGDVWAFEVEAVSFPVVNVSVTASSQVDADQDPNNTINGSGLDEQDQHTERADTMWRSADEAGGAWIQFALDRVYKLDKLKVWNYNASTEAVPGLGFGIKDALIEHSLDGMAWESLGSVELPKATGKPGQAGAELALDGTVAQYVRITAQSNWTTLFPSTQFGLSEVRFYAIPTTARLPVPSEGATIEDPLVTLSWRAGREAAGHEVYVGTDPSTLDLVDTVATPNYDFSADLDQQYVWQVIEVNHAETPTRWEGPVWNFATLPYKTLDDMEAYFGGEDDNPLWRTWLDGYDDAVNNGGRVGDPVNFEPETGIKADGNQSMPFSYGVEGVMSAWATRSFAPARIVDQHGIKTLSLMFHGDVDNAPGQLYIEINGQRTDYLGAMSDLSQPQWMAMRVGLTGVTSIESMTIGVEGGAGIIYVDAIRLYAPDGELLHPEAPGDASLLASYPLNGNTDDASGKGAPSGIAVGDPFYVEGPAGMGQGLDFLGLNQYVSLGTWNPSETTGALTVSLWAKWAGLNSNWQGLIGKRDTWGDTTMMWQFEADINTGVVSFGRAGGSTVSSGLSLVEDQWDHWAVTTDGTTATIYRNGIQVAQGDFDFGPHREAALVYGCSELNGDSPGNCFNGALSEIKLYDAVLPPANVASLAGRTDPVYNPF